MATNVNFAGPVAGSIVNPAQSKMTLTGNYLDIQNDGWAKQYLPELYEKEVERYGNRTIAGFLAMAGAEMPMQSDQVIWSEQGRLHLAYNGTINVEDGVITAIKNIDAPNVTEAHVVRKNATVVAVVEGVVFKALVKVGAEAATDTLTIAPYGAENVNDLAGTSSTGSKAIKFFVYGSEFQKGTDTMVESIEPQFKHLQTNQ